jgi:hypothetical protein
MGRGYWTVSERDLGNGYSGMELPTVWPIYVSIDIQEGGLLTYKGSISISQSKTSAMPSCNDYASPTGTSAA